MLAVAWLQRRRVPLPEPKPLVDESLEAGYGRLSIVCELPRSAAHRHLWEGTVPAISIDGAAPVDVIWGTWSQWAGTAGASKFVLPVGTHQFRIDVRPGSLQVDYKSIDGDVETTSQRVYRFRYEAPKVPTFTGMLVRLR